MARLERDDPSGGAAEDGRPDDDIPVDGSKELAAVVPLEMGARRRERFSAWSSMKSLRALGPRPWKKWGCVRLAMAAARPASAGARVFGFDGAVGELPPFFGCRSTGAEPPLLPPSPDPAPSPKRSKCSNFGAASLQILHAKETTFVTKRH